MASKREAGFVIVVQPQLVRDEDGEYAQLTLERRAVACAPTLSEMQEAVGGYIERIPFGIMSRHRKGVEIDLFVDEEGLLKSDKLPGPVCAGPWIQQVVGPLLIVGSNEDGETVALTAAECDDVRLACGSGLPVVEFRGVSAGWPLPTETAATT